MIIKKIVIIGSGSHAKVVFSEIMKLKEFEILGFVDDFKKKKDLIISFNKKKFYNLGKIKQVIKKKNNFKGIIAVGLNFVRKKIVQEIYKIDKNFKFQKVVSKDAIINSNVSIGEGTFVVSGSIINNGSKIGKHCILNTSCSIDHDNYLKNFSSAGPGAITGGNVVVGEQSHLGLGCVVKDQINISKNTIIGSASLVNKNCEKNSIYFGTPAKKIRLRLSNENYL